MAAGVEEPGSTSLLPGRPAGRLPAAFQSLKLLGVLNVAAMGLSLAAITGGVFGHLLGNSSRYGALGAIVAVPTLIFGTLWAVLLRGHETVADTNVRWGWVASVPVAIANGAVAGALLGALDDSRYVISDLLFGAMVGMTFGVVFWLPWLIATLAFFGLPVLWSHRLAKTGLAGEERGERVIGIASMILALAGLVATWAGEVVTRMGTPPLEHIGVTLLYGFGIGGLAAGALATTIAQVREARRRRFVAGVEGGRVTGYRIAQAPEGKVLVRVTSIGGGYRVADIEEEVYALDAEGRAKAELAVGAQP